jgi:hypothetical protein
MWGKDLSVIPSSAIPVPESANPVSNEHHAYAAAVRLLRHLFAIGRGNIYI